MDLAGGGRRGRGAGRAAPLPPGRTAPSMSGVLMENTPEYLFLLAGAALAGAVVVGINPTRRGSELAGDIRRADCQLLITDTTQVDLLDHLDLGLTPDRILVADDEAYAHRLEGLRPSGDEARMALPDPTPDQLLPADLHLGIDRRAQGGPDDPGPGRPGGGPGGLHHRRRPLLGHAPVPRQRPVGRRPARSGQRGHPGPPSAVLRLQLPPGRAGVPGPPSSTPWVGPSPTSWPPRPPTTTATTSSASCSGPRPRPRTRPPSPSGSASRCSRGTGRARTPSS